MILRIDIQHGFLIKVRNFSGSVYVMVECQNGRTSTVMFYLLSKYVLFQLLTNHYERCWKYYCLPGGWGNFGAASEEELHLSRKLFWGIFDALSQKVIHCNIHLLM